MNQPHHKNTITFGELQHYMALDPFYGTDYGATTSIINDIYRENSGNELYRQFGVRFSLLPCKSEIQRHLLYLWCGFMGLPTYRAGTPLVWQREAFLDNWTQDFEIRIDELMEFLRQYSWPLPVKLFPNEVDNTARKVALDKTEFARAFHDFTVALPQLEKDLEELKAIQPDNMKERQQKKTEIQEIKKRISAIKSGNIETLAATPNLDDKPGNKGIKPEPEVGSPEWRKQNARNAANVKHDLPGGSRDKQQQMREIWATGKYSTRDLCAEEECAALGMSFSAARKALKNTPKP